MKTLILALAVLGFATVAQAGPGCSGSHQQQASDTPPPSEPTS